MPKKVAESRGSIADRRSGASIPPLAVRVPERCCCPLITFPQRMASDQNLDRTMNIASARGRLSPSFGQADCLGA
jgi:hypothetical protein